MKIKKEIKLAVTSIVALVILVWGINFLKGRSIFDRNNVFYSIYDNVDGLKVSSSVVYRGYKVGQITSIRFIGERYDKVLVQFTVGNKLEIPSNSVAFIQNTDLMGTKSINIEAGDSYVYAQSEDTLKSGIQGGLLDQFNEQLAPLKNKVETTINSLDTVLTSVQDILSGNTKQDIEGTFRSLHNMIRNLESASNNVDALMKSEKQKVEEILENVRSITENLQKSNSNISKVFENVADITDSLRSVDIVSIVGNMDRVLQELDIILEKLNNNEGTLGELINNDELYYSLSYLSQNLDKLLTDMQANPKKYIKFSVFNFSSGKGKEYPYGISIYDSDKPLKKDAELYIKHPDLKEYRSNGRFFYMIRTYKKLNQAEKDLETIKKDYESSLIVKIS